MKTVIYALHGFLGQAMDWGLVQQKIMEEQPTWDFVSIDLYHNPQFSPAMNFDQWTYSFFSWMSKFEKENFKEETAKDGRQIKRTIVGYSMGGRLALHLMHKHPDLWSGAALISTNPGLTDEVEKLKRLENDKRWAEKFLYEDFNLVLKDWNSQPVLKGSSEPIRREKNYSKDLIAKSLVNWSLALQKDFRPFLDLWNIRQIWIAGGSDQKFSSILKTLPHSSDVQGWVVEGGFHRLIFEAPEEIAHFIMRVSLPLSAHSSPVG